jgi:RNA polymerase sigma factor (sigma-70 family)
MARDSALSSKTFEEILAWLDPNREVAAAMYVQLRHDLAKLFRWSRCSDPEELTDEVFDRVARKVHSIKEAYEGDPRLYFRAVANNVIKENLKKIKTHISLEDVDGLVHRQIDDDEREDQKLLKEKLLNECIDELSPADRQLLLSYYREEKRGARKLAAKLCISEGTLRVRIYRIRQSLQRKFERKNGNHLARQK